jgi:hypothetical protein
MTRIIWLAIGFSILALWSGRPGVAAPIVGNISLNEEAKASVIVDFIPVPGSLVLCDVAVHIDVTTGVADGCRGATSTVVDDATISDKVRFGFDDRQRVFLFSDGADGIDNTADTSRTISNCGPQTATCRYLSEIVDENGREVTTYKPEPGWAGSDSASPVTFIPTYLIESDTPIPEPGAWWLLATMLLGISVSRFALRRPARVAASSGS